MLDMKVEVAIVREMQKRQEPLSHEPECEAGSESGAALPVKHLPR